MQCTPPSPVAMLWQCSEAGSRAAAPLPSPSPLHPRRPPWRCPAPRPAPPYAGHKCGAGRHPRPPPAAKACARAARCCSHPASHPRAPLAAAAALPGGGGPVAALHAVGARDRVPGMCVWWDLGKGEGGALQAPLLPIAAVWTAATRALSCCCKPKGPERVCVMVIERGAVRAEVVAEHVQGKMAAHFSECLCAHSRECLRACTCTASTRACAGHPLAASPVPSSLHEMSVSGSPGSVTSFFTRSLW